MAKDIIDFVATEEMQGKIERLKGDGAKTTILVRTANRWLNALNWQYGKKK